MYCLDTNIIIDILKGDEKLKDKIINLQLNEIYITTITLCELYKGAFLFHDPDRKVKDVEEFVNSFLLISLDEKSCKEFGKIYLKLKNSGKVISEFDIIIASIVKTNNLTLITKDKHFQNIDELKIEIW